MQKREVEVFLKKKFPELDICPQTDDRNIVTLSGVCESWEQLIDVGHQVAQIPGVRNVVSNMEVKNLKIPQKNYDDIIRSGTRSGEIANVDVVIIGAGISGCGIARELAKYDLDILVVEAGDDVANGASRANNGCIHHGMDCKSGTLKSKLNVLGNRRYDDWDRELGLHLVRCGCLEIVEHEEDLPKLYERFERGLRNQVDGIQMVNPQRAYEIEPALKAEGIPVIAGLYMPSHGVVETPYVCVALAENAAENGVKFLFHCAVGDICVKEGKIHSVVTEKGIIKTKYVINAAGMYADDIAGMAGDKIYTIHNRIGTLAVFDKSVPPTYSVMVDNLSTHCKDDKNKESKGGGSNPTPEQNLLAGPSALEIWDKENVETTPEGLEFLLKNCLHDPHKSKADIIRLFAGGRPADFTEDFIIELSEKTGGFIHVAGIQSPGVASAPAIADMVTDILLEDSKRQGRIIAENTSFNPYRPRKPEFRFLSREEQAELIKKDGRYGKIICRCEQITEGEIVSAIHSPVVPQSVNAIKNRTRAGMGRCQGGFCQPRVLEILARELGKEWTDITLNGEGSSILLCDNRKESRG